MDDRNGRRGRRRGRVTMVLLMALTTLVPTTGADAGLIDDIIGDGGGGGGGGGGSSKTPPAGGITVDGEALGSGQRIEDEGAHRGAFLRTTATGLALPDGWHRVTIRARGARYTRVLVTLDGVPVAGHNLGTMWTTVTAIVPPSATERGTLGLVAERLPWIDDVRAVDIDWIHAGDQHPTPHTVGNEMRHPDGREFVPKGVTFPGFHAAQSVGGKLDLPRTMAEEQWAWGVTLVRIPLNQEHWLANCASTKDGVAMGYRAAVAAEVEALSARGIQVLLTLTRTERGKATGCAPAALPVFKEMADQRSLKFWRSVAARFADDEMVLFDLFNEPHGISDDVWHHGGTITYTEGSGINAQERTYQAVGMQNLYDAVRSVGADNLVVVSGTRWAADPRAALRRPLSGYGIVLAAHTYCHGCSPPDLHPQLDLLVDEEIRARHPVIISETGWVEPWSSRYNRKFVDWAADKGLGWTAYAWGHPNAAYSLLASWVPASFDAGGTMTYRPSWAGAPIWNDLADVRVARGLLAQPLPEN